MYIVCLHKREKITGTVINCIGGPWLKKIKTNDSPLKYNYVSNIEYQHDQ